MSFADTKLIFGCGYLGGRVARQWLQADCQVHAVTRSPRRAEELSRQGIRPIVADLLQADAWPSLPAASTVLFAVGYDRSSHHSIHDVYVQGLRRAVDSLDVLPERFIYISSTGVYGQGDGGWVDETSECLPLRPGGRACLDAERWLADSRVAELAVVLRLAGLYGPGRVPLRQAIAAGQPLAAPSEGHLNLIHVDDAAAMVLAVERQISPPECLLVADGHPVERAEYYAEVARLISAPPPQFQPPAADDPRGQRAATDQRISVGGSEASWTTRFDSPITAPVCRPF